MKEEKDIVPISDSIKAHIESVERLQDTVRPLIQQQESINRLVKPVLEQQRVLQTAIESTRIHWPIVSGLEGIQRGLEATSAMLKVNFQSPAIKAIQTYNTQILGSLASSMVKMVSSPIISEIQSFTSGINAWLKTIDFSPLVSVLESIKNIGFDHEYDEINEIFLKAMFDARWFPYAGWIADFTVVGEVIDILDTSRASKNRTKRIDKLLFSYYNKDEINRLKKGWRQLGLPSYMTRILVQSIQAYHRREYALTVSALSTLWEGIIQEKVKDNSYRISGKTRQNLTKLIEQNEFDNIFASFCEEFIFYDCKNPEQVKEDVPGRHSIAHCWYNTYPNRKTALNAILFTDFLLELKPLENQEEQENAME